MSVHDKAYAQTYNIAIRRLPSLKDFLRAPLSVDHATPSQSHSLVNVGSHQTEEKFDAPEPPMIRYYCGQHGCRMWTCAALANGLRARKIKTEDDFICYHDGQRLRPKPEGMKGQVDEWWTAEKVIQDAEEEAKEQSAQEEGHSPSQQSHPFRILDDQKDTYLMLCAETPNAVDDDKASIASELESAPPNSPQFLFIDAETETETCDQPRSATDCEMAMIRTHQTPNAICENMQNVEAESEIVRDKELSRQPEWLA
jgi:hypothetical protein